MTLDEIMALEMLPRFNVTLSVRVDDPVAVFNAAMAKHTDVDPQSAREDFENDDGSINIEACLQFIYDPGTSAPGTELEATDCQKE
jgi:sporulation-control protein spo0M